MRHTTSMILIVVLAFITGRPLFADALQVTATPVSATTKRGQPVAMAVNLKNVLAPREPVTITAEDEWEDEFGVARSTTASATITVVQPVKVNRYKVIIPALFALVAGSAKIDGQPVAPALDTGQLTFEIDRTLIEGESVTLEYSVKAQ
ncbi:MAG: hypothetical protein GX139_01670 [Armatimonadetes bacterium]|nr:hypothetical protein [Armatimonadota bacterium]